MKCPVCGAESRVLHSQDARRRRECVHCRHRWSTREVPEADVQKLDAARQLARAILEG